MQIDDQDLIQKRIAIIQADGVDHQLISTHDPIVVLGLTGRIPTLDHIKIGTQLSSMIASQVDTLPIHYVLNDQYNDKGYAVNASTQATFKSPMVSSHHRTNMLDLAISQHPECVRKNWEIAAGGLSYTVHTLAALAHVYPNNPLVFIAGEGYKYLHKWYQGLHMCQYAHIIGIDNQDNAPLDPPLSHYLEEHLDLSAAPPYTFPIITHDKPGQITLISQKYLGLSAHSTSYAIECIHNDIIPENISPEIYQYVINKHIV